MFCNSTSTVYIAAIPSRCYRNINSIPMMVKKLCITFSDYLVFSYCLYLLSILSPVDLFYYHLRCLQFLYSPMSLTHVCPMNGEKNLQLSSQMLLSKPAHPGIHTHTSNCKLPTKCKLYIIYTIIAPILFISLPSQVSC